MVVLTAISLLGRRWLHKENYSFKEQMKLSSSSRTEDVLASTPSEYWLLGFKDRNLEEEYLNDLADVSKERLFLGYGMCTFFVFAAQMFSFIFRFSFVDDFHNDGEKENYIEALALYGTVFVVFIAGLISR